MVILAFADNYDSLKRYLLLCKIQMAKHFLVLEMKLLTDSIILDASAGASGTVNGAVSDSTTVTVDGVSGTIAVGQVVTVSGAGSTPAASITATSR